MDDVNDLNDVNELDEVIRGLRVLGADVVDGRIVVDLYGGVPVTCESVTFRYRRRRQRRAGVKMARDWARTGVPVTLMRVGATTTLWRDDARD
jgi:hypothetical protein